MSPDKKRSGGFLFEGPEPSERGQCDQQVLRNSGWSPTDEGLVAGLLRLEISILFRRGNRSPVASETVAHSVRYEACLAASFSSLSAENGDLIANNSSADL